MPPWSLPANDHSLPFIAIIDETASELVVDDIIESAETCFGDCAHVSHKDWYGGTTLLLRNMHVKWLHHRPLSSRPLQIGHASENHEEHPSCDASPTFVQAQGVDGDGRRSSGSRLDGKAYRSMMRTGQMAITGVNWWSSSPARELRPSTLTDEETREAANNELGDWLLSIVVMEWISRCKGK